MLKQIKNRLADIGYPDALVEFTKDLANGDITTNVAMRYAAEQGINPRDLAAKIVVELGEVEHVEKIEIAGPGFINFWVDRDYVVAEIKNIITTTDYGYNQVLQGKKVLIEHSSPNLFKPFHVGHAMNNAIGEAIKGLYLVAGAEVVSISYPSDVSLGIGKAVWSLLQKDVDTLTTLATLQEKLDFLGQCYVDGTREFENSDQVKEEVREITRQIYENEDTDAVAAYELGKSLTLEYFQEITKSLGSEFNDFIFESQAGEVGRKIVKEHTAEVFAVSDGAVVFVGEKYGLHTRVFINSEGYPTYEAKDVGLLKLKFDKYNPDISVTVTDIEQGPYFEVMITAAGEINPVWQEKTIHVTHGRMTLQGKKMSSRLGGIPTASEILATLYAEIDSQSPKQLSKDDVHSIAVAALKYAILKNTPGKNVNFDPSTSLSFEGDSGPYLQYSAVRAQSLLVKAAELNIVPQMDRVPDNSLEVEKLLIRFPQVISRAVDELAPQMIVLFLTELASAYNSFYASGRIADPDNKLAPYQLAVSQAVIRVLKNGLTVLGMQIPSEM